jgi:predicted flap endonuclease-1-like 5' DNA nuclease
MGWLILILFFSVVLIVWIALTRNAKEKPDFDLGSHHETHATGAESEMPAENLETHRTTEPVEQITEAPVVAAAPMSVKKDDLTIVEGIGPKVSVLLNEAGIMNLDQLAEADPGQVRQILEKSGLQFIDPSSWNEQARLAAEGKMADFEALKESLRAGRKTS